MEFRWIQWHPTREISFRNFDNVTLFTAIQILRWLHLFFIECVPTHLYATVLRCIKDQLHYNSGLLQSETLPIVTQNHSWLDKIHKILVSLTIVRREGNGEAGLVCKGLWCFNGEAVLFYVSMSKVLVIPQF